MESFQGCVLVAEVTAIAGCVPAYVRGLKCFEVTWGCSMCTCGGTPPVETRRGFIVNSQKKTATQGFDFGQVPSEGLSLSIFLIQLLLLSGNVYG